MLRHFKLKQSVEIKSLRDFAPRPHEGHLEHAPKSLSSLNSHTFALTWRLVMRPAEKQFAQKNSGYGPDHVRMS